MGRFIQADGLVDVRLTAEILSELRKGYKILKRLIKRKRTSK